MAAIAVTLVLMLCSRTLAAQQDVRAVRSAYVYNLTKYVSWPQTKYTLLIGIVGDADTGAAMKAMLDGKSSDGRIIRVLVNPGDSVLQGCDLVYMTSGVASGESHIFTLIRGLPILTVGEDRSFPMRGGMVGLVRSADRIEIAVNLAVVRAAGLKLSSRVLDLATIVSSRGRPE
jgi:YfiR/HmsC-like